MLIVLSFQEIGVSGQPRSEKRGRWLEILGI